jgi:hypothetical protein
MNEATRPDKGQASESYIALCREAKLQREYQEGDLHWESVYVSGNGEIQLCTETCFHPQPGEQWVWIPRLDQLLRLIESEGWEWSINTYGSGQQGHAVVWKSDGSVNPKRLYFIGHRRSAGSVDQAPEVMLRLLIRIRSHSQEPTASGEGQSG